LCANEALEPLIDHINALAKLPADVLSSYPSSAPLERRLALRHGIDPSRVIVSAGGDDAIDRLCRAVLGPGRDLLMTTPSFEMIATFAELARAGVRRVAWRHGCFPVESVLDTRDRSTACIAVVSPNNPTGGVISETGLRRISAEAPECVIMLDLAYVEFADEDLTGVALSLPNVVVIRTFSKGFGLAGCRVGYAMGPRPLIDAMRRAGGPYPVNGVGLALAEAILIDSPQRLSARVLQVRRERTQLESVVRELGVTAPPSQGNFVYIPTRKAHALWCAMVERGVLVRLLSDARGVPDALRITCPGNEAAFQIAADVLVRAWRSIGGEP